MSSNSQKCPEVERPDIFVVKHYYCEEEKKLLKTLSSKFNNSTCQIDPYLYFALKASFSANLKNAGVSHETISHNVMESDSDEKDKRSDIMVNARSIQDLLLENMVKRESRVKNSVCSSPGCVCSKKHRCNHYVCNRCLPNGRKTH